MRLWLFCVILVIACSSILASEQDQQNPLVGDNDPVYVYFIHDPVDDNYYKSSPLGLSGWGKITESEVWTARKQAERVLSMMYGSRADRCVIKKFLILPAKE